MPRSLYKIPQQIINRLSPTLDSQLDTNTHPKIIEVATTNPNKLKEIRSILKDYQIIEKKLKIDEVQSADPEYVATQKAKTAFEANGYNPVLIEDTSLDIKGLNGNPGPYVNDFCSDQGTRALIAENWLQDKDRTAIARVTLALYDGIEVKLWQGTVTGQIATKLIGNKGFGWDDMFIPDGQKGNKKLTFAQMSLQEKNKFSMRRKALENFAQNPPNPYQPVFMLPEPYGQELQRVQVNKLQDKKAIHFAYQLEALSAKNKQNSDLTAPHYSPINQTENSYFTRYLLDKKTKSLGLILTDVDRDSLKMQANGKPVLWQMGPERRHLALVQRAEFFMDHQNEEVHQVLDEIEKNKNKFPQRSNQRSMAIERALGLNKDQDFSNAKSLKEIGYKKLSTNEKVSRTISARLGLYTKIGKYARSIYGVGCLPYISGWRDVIVTSAIAHIPTFVHRNHLHAIDFQNQIDLIISAKETIKKLKLSKKAKERALRNVGAALGTNPEVDLKKAKALYEQAGVKLFRIYTINSDHRVIDTARALRQEFGDEVEIFVGQIVDKDQASQLIAENVRVDGLIFGHGGGRQCTSAINGMALSTLEEIYQILIDADFNQISVLVEGGIGSSVGGLLVLGVDGILRNAQFANCVIEQGDLYFQHQSGQICQPYHGSASAPAMIIESYSKDLAQQRLYYSGRTKNVEGVAGYIFYKERANSMSFYVNQFKHYAARTLADLGVGSIKELREFQQKNKLELLREVSQDAFHTSKAYWGKV